IAQLVNPLPAPHAGGQPVIKGARSPKTPQFNSGEDFLHIMNQVWGLGEPPDFWKDPDKWGPKVQQLINARKERNEPAVPPMDGYIRDYNLELLHNRVPDPQPDQLKEILETYLPEQLPVLAGLARAFAVSDE